MTKRIGAAWVYLLPLLLLACGDDEVPAVDEPDAEPLVRCQLSSDCPEGTVCRADLCTPAPACEERGECETGEECQDGFCAFDPTLCQADADCDSGEICLVGDCREGCRNDADCAEEQRCTDDLECVRRPCTEVPCDDRHECNEETGECELLPCNGGCEEPLRCRLEDDTCVECFEHDECGVAQSCTEAGFCRNLDCESHQDCPEGTFCINEMCDLPPDCEDDDLEDNDFYEAADLPLLSEGTHDGLVSCPYDDDYFEVVADGDHSLTVELVFSHEDGNVQLELLNTVGVTFAQRISDDDDESVTVNIFKTGVYTIRVWQEDGGTQGAPYEMHISTGPPVEVPQDICLVDGFEPNDTPEDATLLFTGRWTGPSICAGDEDYYTVRAEAGEFLKVCITPSEVHGVQVGLEVLDSDGDVELSGAGITMFCVEEDLLVGDDWLAHVFATTPGEETPYYITFFIDPGCRLYEDDYDQRGVNNRIPAEDDPPLESIAPDEDHELRICPNNSDYWPVDLLRRDALTASIEFDHEEGDLQMKLHRPNGSVRVASVGSGDRETINYQAELDGTYYLRIYGEGDDQGAYTFRYSVTPYCQVDDFEDNDTAEAAAALTEGTTEILWRCAGDDDFYEIVLPSDPEPGRLAVELVTEPLEGALQLEVTPPGEDAVVGDPSETGASVELTGDLLFGAENPYLVRVSGDENVQNSYQLTVEVE